MSSCDPTEKPHRRERAKPAPIASAKASNQRSVVTIVKNVESVRKIQNNPSRSLRLFQPPLLDQRSHERRPPGLVRCPQARAIITVEILVKQQQVAPVRIVLELGTSSINRPMAL